MLSPSEMYEICSENSTLYDGEFFMGVLTTGIYCIPSCKARLPLFKNVVFFKNKEKAKNFGLRGCKRCRSEFFPNTEPTWFSILLKLLESKKNQRVSLKEMERITGVQISTINRYFKEYLLTTPSAFHRSIRLKEARKLLILGVDIGDIPYMTGFNSLSGFRSAFFNVYKQNPGDIKNDRK